MRAIDADKLEKTLYAIVDESQSEHIFIDAITDAIGNAPTIEVPRWIPVTERLPEKGGYYLVHHKHGLISQRLYYEGEGELFVRVKYDPVTHWMPLPTPPKDGDT